MKYADKNKPIKTTPDGIWEATPNKSKDGEFRGTTTDLQGNGYPLKDDSNKYNSKRSK